MDTQTQVFIAIVAVGLLGGTGWKLWQGFKTAVGNAVTDQLKRLTDAITQIDERLAKVDMEASKNFLVRCLADVEKGQGLTVAETMRFKEQYDYYLNHGGNSYIKDEVDKFKREGKL